MNALMAGVFVTASWICLAVSASRGRDVWPGSKAGLVLYACGTFVWSLKGYELGDMPLILISAAQTIAVLVGVARL